DPAGAGVTPRAANRNSRWCVPGGIARSAAAVDRSLPGRRPERRPVDRDRHLRLHARGAADAALLGDGRRRGPGRHHAADRGELDGATRHSGAGRRGEVTMADGISVTKLNAWFGPSHVLCDIDLAVAPRAVTAIIGPSGCGKSTFIRCLNRMHEVVPGARVV